MDYAHPILLAIIDFSIMAIMLYACLPSKLQGKIINFIKNI